MDDIEYKDDYKDTTIIYESGDPNKIIYQVSRIVQGEKIIHQFEDFYEFQDFCRRWSSHILDKKVYNQQGL